MVRHHGVALGRFVMRAKEYLVAVRVRERALALSTMRFHDEVRDPSPIPTGGRKPSKQALAHALAIIEELSTEWDPHDYEDCYRERLKRIIDSKRKGQRVRAPRPEKEAGAGPALMEGPG